MRKIPVYFILLLLMACVSACKDHKQTHSFSINDIEMFAEGPLFEGSNTVQAVLDDPLEQFLKTNN